MIKVNSERIKLTATVIIAVLLSILTFCLVVIAIYFHDNDPENHKRHFQIQFLKNSAIKSYANMIVYVNGVEQRYLTKTASDTDISLKITSRSGLKPVGKITSTITSIDSVAYQLKLEIEYGKNSYDIYRIFPQISEGQIEGHISKISKTIDSLDLELTGLRKLVKKIEIENGIIRKEE